MGSRIGYRISQKVKYKENGKEKEKVEVSQILRKQWATSIVELTENTWKTLLGNKKINDGSIALRHDLNIGRTCAAMVFRNYEPPFHSLESTTNCDIGDNGLIEIDITKYDSWVIYHYKVDWETGTLGRKHKIAKMDIGGFEWLISDGTRENIGEGLF